MGTVSVEGLEVGTVSVEGLEVTRGGYSECGGSRGGYSGCGGTRGGYSECGGTRGGYSENGGTRGGCSECGGTEKSGVAGPFTKPLRWEKGVESPRKLSCHKVAAFVLLECLYFFRVQSCSERYELKWSMLMTLLCDSMGLRGDSKPFLGVAVW